MEPTPKPSARIQANPATGTLQRILRAFDLPAAQAPKNNIAEDAVFGICALAMIAVAIFYLAFAVRPLIYDEVVLYNPIYMYLHTGVMTYPAHHHFDDMTVHPPPHYLVIAWVMRLGLSLYHAAAVSPSLLFLVLCVLLLRSAFSLHLRLSIAAGVFLSTFVWNYTFTIRPDMDMALAWITGLVAMECSRQKGWDPKRLFLGSLLLAYASAAHYTGPLAAGSIVFYVAWIWRTLPPPQAKRAAATAAVAVALIALPFLFFFVIPFRHGIVDMFKSTGAVGTLLSPLALHREAYRLWGGQYGVSPGQPLTQTMLKPLWASLVPAALVGPVLFVFFRATRVLAVACLPLLFFILFGAGHKLINYTGYFVPEFMIYFSAVLFVAGSLIALAAQSLGWSFPRWLRCTAALVFTAIVVHEHPSTVAWKARRDIDDLEIARAAARSIIGPGALVGARAADGWYVSGGDHFYDMDQELESKPTLAALDLPSFFASFPAIVINPSWTWHTVNKERVTLTTEFARGALKLRGFVFSERNLNPESPASMVIVGTRRTKPVRGFASDAGTLYEFQEAPGTDWIYYAAVCPSNVFAHEQIRFLSTLNLPGRTLNELDQEKLIRTTVGPANWFTSRILPQTKACSVIEQIPVAAREISRQSLLAQLHDEIPIRFYRNASSAIAMAGNARPERMKSALVNMEGLKIAGSNDTLRIDKGMYRLQVAGEKWHDAAYLPLDLDSVPGAKFLYVEGKVTRGQLAISVQREGVEFDLEHEIGWRYSDGVTAIAVPVSFHGTAKMVIRNMLAEPAEIGIKRIAVLGGDPALD